MNPKDKAKELYDKYEFDYIQNYTSKHEVKQCALIAVTEIINSNPHSNLINFYSDIHSTMYYWIEVKNEIEKL